MTINDLVKNFAFLTRHLNRTNWIPKVSFIDKSAATLITKDNV